jgi:hypothetical protein
VPVHFEPVSECNSLLTGKNTGKIEETAPSLPAPQPLRPENWGLLPAFPAHANREFAEAKQGTLVEDQGIFSAIGRNWILVFFRWANVDASRGRSMAFTVGWRRVGAIIAVQANDPARADAQRIA